MAILEMIASTFAIVYLFLILEVVFSSTKNIMYKQQAFEGRLIFFIYSLLVYYKKLRVGIFLWDTFLNEPIIQAYELLNTFLTYFFGISIANDPWSIFLFLMPASFVYHFTNYWFQYGFGDNRIAKMVSFLAVAVFLSTGGFGLVHILSSPFLLLGSEVAKLGFTGLPWTFLVSFVLVFLPTADLTSIIQTKWAGIELFSAMPEWLVVVLIGALIVIFTILLVMVGSFMVKDIAEKEFSLEGSFNTLLWFPVYAIAFSFGVIALSAFLLYGDFLAGFAAISVKFLQISVFLLILAGLSIVAEIIVFAAVYMTMRNLGTAFSS